MIRNLGKILFSGNHAAALVSAVWIEALLLILDTVGVYHINNYKGLCLLFIGSYIISVLLQALNLFHSE